MKKSILMGLFYMQKGFVFILSIFLTPKSINEKNDTWVVGTEEVAHCVYNISKALDKSISVSLGYHRFYQSSYDYQINIRNKYLAFFIKLFYGPYLFVSLSNQYDSFFYVGGAGFLISYTDGRAFEFKFLTKRNKKIVCYFTGSEIRSFELMKEIGKQYNIDVITDYQKMLNPSIASSEAEDRRKKLALSADKYAHLIFNASIDQKSYTTRQNEPFLYFYPDHLFVKNDEKFERLPIRILHAPSNPFSKGTPIVRAAITKLKKEGYLFEYIELIHVSHEEVLNALRQSQIVLNEFYAFMPGVFGVEALASHCALLTSANADIETSLPQDSNEAWLVTGYWEIYDHLKLVLDEPSLQKSYADKGYLWAQKHASFSHARTKLTQLLDFS